MWETNEEKHDKKKFILSYFALVGAYTRAVGLPLAVDEHNYTPCASLVDFLNSIT